MRDTSTYVTELTIAMSMKGVFCLSLKCTLCIQKASNKDRQNNDPSKVHFNSIRIGSNCKLYKTTCTYILVDVAYRN